MVAGDFQTTLTARRRERHTQRPKPTTSSSSSSRSSSSRKLERRRGGLARPQTEDTHTHTDQNRPWTAARERCLPGRDVVAALIALIRLKAGVLLGEVSACVPLSPSLTLVAGSAMCRGLPDWRAHAVVGLTHAHADALVRSAESSDDESGAEEHDAELDEELEVEKSAAPSRKSRSSLSSSISSRRSSVADSEESIQEEEEEEHGVLFGENPRRPRGSGCVGCFARSRCQAILLLPPPALRISRRLHGCLAPPPSLAAGLARTAG